MTQAQATQGLRELINCWRKYNPHPTTPISESQHRCANELEALLPALEAAISRGQPQSSLLISDPEGMKKQLGITEAAQPQASDEAREIVRKVFATIDNESWAVQLIAAHVQKEVALAVQEAVETMLNELNAHDREIREKALDSIRKALEIPVTNWVVKGHGIYASGNENAPLIKDRAASTANLELIAEALNFNVRRKLLTELTSRDTTDEDGKERKS